MRDLGSVFLSLLPSHVLYCPIIVAFISLLVIWDSHERRRRRHLLFVGCTCARVTVTAVLLLMALTCLKGGDSCTNLNVVIELYEVRLCIV